MKTKAKRTTRTATVLYRAFDFSRHYGKVKMHLVAKGSYIIEPLDGSESQIISHTDIIAMV